MVNQTASSNSKHTLHVSNIPQWLEDDEFTRHFLALDGCLACRLMRDKPRGSFIFGFVDFDSNESAAAARAIYDGWQGWNSRGLHIQFSHVKVRQAKQAPNTQQSNQLAQDPRTVGRSAANPQPSHQNHSRLPQQHQHQQQPGSLLGAQYNSGPPPQQMVQLMQQSSPAQHQHQPPSQATPMMLHQPPHHQQYMTPTTSTGPSIFSQMQAPPPPQQQPPPQQYLPLPHQQHQRGPPGPQSLLMDGPGGILQDGRPPLHPQHPQQYVAMGPPTSPLPQGLPPQQQQASRYVALGPPGHPLQQMPPPAQQMYPPGNPPPQGLGPLPPQASFQGHQGGPQTQGQGQGQGQGQRNRTLYVEHLPHGMKDREIAHIFRPFRGFLQVKLVPARNQPNRSGHDLIHHCFVDFDTNANARLAMDKIDGYVLDLKQENSPALRISFAKTSTYTKGHHHHRNNNSNSNNNNNNNKKRRRKQ